MPDNPQKAALNEKSMKGIVIEKGPGGVARRRLLALEVNWPPAQ